MRDLAKIIKSCKVDNRYDMSLEELVYLLKIAKRGGVNDIAEAIRDSFKYGYEMGMRSQQSKNQKNRKSPLQCANISNGQ